MQKKNVDSSRCFSKKSVGLSLRICAKGVRREKRSKVKVEGRSRVLFSSLFLCFFLSSIVDLFPFSFFFSVLSLARLFLCNSASLSPSWRSPRRGRDERIRVRHARGRPGGRSERSRGGGGRSSSSAADVDVDDGFSGCRGIRPAPIAPAASRGPFRRHGKSNWEEGWLDFVVIWTEELRVRPRMRCKNQEEQKQKDRRRPSPTLVNSTQPSQQTPTHFFLTFSRSSPPPSRPTSTAPPAHPRSSSMSFSLASAGKEPTANSSAPGRACQCPRPWSERRRRRRRRCCLLRSCR